MKKHRLLGSTYGIFGSVGLQEAQEFAFGVGSLDILIVQGPLFLKKDFNYLFLERGREGEREGEKHQCVVTLRAPCTGDVTTFSVCFWLSPLLQFAFWLLKK